MRETTFVTSCLHSWSTIPLWKGVYSKRKEFAPKERQNNFDGVVSLESISILIKQVRILIFAKVDQSDLWYNVQLIPKTKYNIMCYAQKRPLCNQWTMQALISLYISAGRSGPSLSAYRISGYCSIRRWTENVQIRLHRCAYTSEPTLSAKCMGPFGALNIIWYFLAPDKRSSQVFFFPYFSMKTYVCCGYSWEAPHWKNNVFDLGLTSLSTIFQSYRNRVWLWQEVQCSLLECCLTEISRPRHFHMIFHPVTLYWHWADQF